MTSIQVQNHTYTYTESSTIEEKDKTNIYPCLLIKQQVFFYLRIYYKDEKDLTYIIV